MNNIVVASKGEVLITISFKDAFLYTCSHESDWILDFGASYHATPSKENCICYKACNMGQVFLGNKSLCNIEGIGYSLIKIEDGCSLLLK